MTRRAEKGKVKEQEPQKLFYIFYNDERWNNWLTSLNEADFEGDPDSEQMPEGLAMLYSFSEDITLSVLKIIKLWQNERFSKEDAQEKLAGVEAIVMSPLPEGKLEEVVGPIQLTLLVLFASCRRFMEGEFETDLKGLVKKGRALPEDQLEEALDCASHIGASVINGATCCSKFVKDDLENPTLFDEWLIEIETMSEAFKSLKKFDEEPGESS
jgi:hypothetical protein